TSAAVLDSTRFVTAYRNTNTLYANAVVSSLNIATPATSNNLGMATNAASANGTVNVASNGIVTGLTGLTAGSTYYWSAATGLTTVSQTYKVGIALSSSSILLNSGSGAGSDQFFGDMIFANNFRITEGWEYPQSLVWKNQLNRDIMSLDENGNLNISGSLTASNIGANIFSLLGTTTIDELTNATSTATSTTPELQISAWAGAFADASDSLKNALKEFSDAVVQVFGRAIYATVGIFEKIFSKEIHTDKLCVSDGSGETCVTRAQLDSLLAGVAGAVSATSATSTASSSANSAGGDSSTAGGGVSSGTPIIKISGNNPARIVVGDTYGDLGAIITGPTEADKNLGIHTFLDGVAMDTIQLDTSAAGEHKVDYVATNSFGAATSTRTVIIETPATPTANLEVSPPSDATSTSTPATPIPSSDGGATGQATADSTATTTSATSTTP
ncbi:MAG: hypothetical protein AAB899_05025, partial [Patescibacteria group bacterium]